MIILAYVVLLSTLIVVMFAARMASSRSCAYSCSAYHTDFFFLRFPISINGQITKIKGEGNFTALCSPTLSESLSLSATLEKISSVLADFDELQVRVTRCFHDKNFPIVSIDFPPNKIFENISSLLSKVHKVCHQISLAINSLLKRASSQCDSQSLTTDFVKLDVGLELYLCSPSREDTRLQQVTASNARFFVDMYENSTLFEFSSLLEHRSSNEGRKINFADLVSELSKAVDKWFAIGVQLGVPPYILDAVRKQYYSPTDCLTEMLIWVMDNTQLTWSKVVQALCKVDKKSLAHGICSKYSVVCPGDSGKEKRTTAFEVDEREKLMLETKAATEVVRSDIQKITEEEYPLLKATVESLMEEKTELRKKLETERKGWDLLMEYRNQSIRDEQKKEELNGKICSLQEMILDKEKVMKELQAKLEHSEQEYTNVKLKLKLLMQELSQRTCELERKSNALQQLEKSLLENDRVLQATRSEDEDKLQWGTANSAHSQQDDIRVQIDKETKIVIKNQQELKEVERTLTRLKDDIATTLEKVRQKQNYMLEATNDRASSPSSDDSEATSDQEQVECQIEITKCNIELLDLRSEHALQMMKLKSLQTETDRRMDNLKSKKNLLPDISKCQLEGLDAPVHKTEVGQSVEFKAIVCDEEGKHCAGHHTITAHVKVAYRQELIIASPDKKRGYYTFKFTPKLPIEHTLTVFIDDTLFNHMPRKLFVTNSPHLPSSTVSGGGMTHATKNKVAALQVCLADEHCYPINSKQTVTVQLSVGRDLDSLVLPMQIATCELPSVYSISYMPSTSGECTLTVLVNGLPIANPYKVTVKSSSHSPLSGAALDGQLEFIKMLLKRGETISNRGDTALHEASRNGHIDTMLFLIERGANVNSNLNRQQRTPLMLAAWNGHASAVDLLVSMGADVNTIDKRSRTALMFAAWHGHASTAEALIKHKADVNAEDKVEDRPLHDAARNGHIDVIHVLLAHNADVDAQNDDGQTPLMMAASNGHSSAAQVLIKKGANVNIRDNECRSPLLFAVENKHSSTVATLIEEGANVNAKNYNGNTALHVASGNGRLKKESDIGNAKTLEVLIKRRAHVNSQNNDLQTPLHFASRYGCIATVRTLVHSGADANAKDGLSRTALDCAREYGHKKVYEYLQSVNQTTV